MKHVYVALCVLLLSASAGFGQARGRGTGASSTAKTPVSVRVTVRDPNGASLDTVRVTLSGDASGDFTTAGAGLVIIPNLKDGTYRLRCERAGFTTLEREFTLRG